MEGGEILLEIPVVLWDQALSSSFAQWEQQSFRKEKMPLKDGKC